MPLLTGEYLFMFHKIFGIYSSIITACLNILHYTYGRLNEQIEEI